MNARSGAGETGLVIKTMASTELDRARELVLEHGWNSTCYQILNPGFTLWFSSGGDAVIGYISRYGTRVVGGAPVCAERRLAGVAEEFEHDARCAGERVCYFGAEERLERLYGGEDRYSVILLGAQPVWDPHDWLEIVTGHASLRAQLHRARNKGVFITEWPAAEAHDHPALRRCLDEWLATRGLPPLHFLVETDTLSRSLDRRWFIADRGEEVVGFLVTSPVPERNGWLVEQFVRGAGAVNGTTELMLDAAMQALARSGSTYVTLGLAPLSTHTERAQYANPLWLRMLLTWMRAHGRRFYDFRGLEAFKAKFRPHHWDPVYAITNEQHVRLQALYAVAGAFSNGSPVSLLSRAFWYSIRREASALTTRLLPGAGRSTLGY